MKTAARLLIVLIPARPQIPNHALFPQKLAINRKASFAFVFLNVFDNLIGTCSVLGTRFVVVRFAKLPTFQADISVTRRLLFQNPSPCDLR
jgi:hypothetical protein